MGMIETFSGMIDPLNPKPEQIKLIDIVHSLSQICRFIGHTKFFYSVAQHSILVSNVVDKQEDKLWALLHDASEAYLCDIPTPVKSLIDGYQVQENIMMEAIAQKFELDWPIPDSVMQADIQVLLAEKRDLMLGNSSPWKEFSETPYPYKIPCVSIEMVRYVFKHRLYVAFKNTNRGHLIEQELNEF